MASDERPTGLKANKGIELLTFGTPNGYKASILLEELKDAYGTDYTWQSINIGQNIQKEPWFTALNPNGRIPVIVDHDQGGFAVFEGLAILNYLTRHYDPDHKFSFTDPLDVSTAEQWMSWQHGGLGPMQGQANHFARFASEKIPYGIQRYVGETERLFGVLEARLAGRDYVAGAGAGRYSIADIAIWGWAAIGPLSGVDMSRFPNVVRWIKSIEARPAVQRGIAVPNPPRFTFSKFLENLEADPEARKAQEEFVALVKKSQEQYGYKYTSP